MVNIDDQDIQRVLHQLHNDLIVVLEQTRLLLKVPNKDVRNVALNIQGSLNNTSGHLRFLTNTIERKDASLKQKAARLATELEMLTRECTKIVGSS